MADTPEDANYWDRLADYFGGRCPAEERIAVEGWISADPAREREIERLRWIWSRAGRVDPLGDPGTPHAWDALWAAAQHSSDGESPRALPVVQRPARPARRSMTARDGAEWRTVPLSALGVRAARPLFAMAAAVIIALGVGLTVRHNTRRALPDHEYATAAGQRLSVTLVDGTQLALAPASRVRVAAGYGTSSREVQLEGEAYFTVAHDGAHPFAVRARGAVVRDVGTAFDVRAYREDATARIAVAEGVVMVGEVTAHAGDVATASNGRIAVTHRADVTALIAWTRGALVFRDTPLRVAAADLARWYGLDVTVMDSRLIDRPVTGTITTEPVDEALRLIAHAAGADARRVGRSATFTPVPPVS